MYNDEHIYYDYLEEYTSYYVFQQFSHGEKLFKNLIKPQMYQKALSDFVANGRFTTFPTKYVYQWMGILMRNTAILRECTSIAGHDIGYPIDEFVDVFFEGDMDSFEEYAKTLRNKGTFSPEFGWMERDEEESEDVESENVDLYDAYCQFLEDKGFWDWLVLPDGSGAYSDFGIRPLEELIMQYTEDSTPEQTIVLINKILDVTHQRGDLASAFIEGGKSSLTKISNNSFLNENKNMNTKQEIFDYKPYILSLSHYMRDKGYTAKKLPKVILDNTDQGDGVFVYTGYFDPNKKAIRLFIHNRHPKDVLRTLAHELIHKKQDVDGIIDKSGYTGDKITEDKNLVKLEEEAYLKGNMAFRSWTEEEQKKGKLK